jgi:ribose 5-phosphate isomerase B
MRVVIGSDHAGYQLKEHLKKSLAGWGHEVDDVGTHTTDSTDYPDWARLVGERVAGESATGVLGVLVCGTGIGVSIAANKVRGVRAARCDEPYSARMARAHNDANVLCMGERVIGSGVAEQTLKAFLDTPFEGGRHALRVGKIGAIERG